MSARPNRHRFRSARPVRALLAVLALFAALAIPAQAEPPGDGTPPPEPTLSIDRGDGRAPIVKAFGELQAKVTERNFELPSGESPTLRGFLLGDLFRALGIPLTGFSSLIVTSASGPEVEILWTQVGGDTDPLVYLDDAGRLTLLRPKLAGEGRSETATAGDDGVLRVRKVTEDKLVASDTKVKVGESVDFSVTTPAGLDPSTVEYEWDFNDGGVVRNRKDRMRYSFRVARPHTVAVYYYVGGSRVGGEAFIPPMVDVTVTDKPKRTGDGDGRRTDDRRARRDTGDGGGTDGGGGGTGSGTGGGSDPGYTDPGYDTPETPAVTPPPVTPRPRRRTPAKPVEKAPAGEVVEGYLLASANAPLPTGGGVRAPDEVKRAVNDPDGPLHVPAVVWVLIGLLGLGLLGWTLESRTTLPYFKP